MGKGIFIIGLPGESHESLIHAADLIRDQNLIDSYDASVLDVEPQNEIAGLVDIANMAIDPKKYGFEELRFSPDYYWRHKTLDIDGAYRIRDHWMKTISANKNIFRVGSVMYLDLLSMGIKREDIKRILSSQPFIVNQLRNKYLNEYVYRLTSK